MTLAISLATPYFVIQASDRRVITRRADRNEIHDPRANKTLIVSSRDGVYALSYSGVAYTNHKPTDVRIAEHVLGFSVELQNYTVFDFMPIRPHPDIGLSLRRVEQGLQQDWSRSAERRERFCLEVVGWQYNRRRRWRWRPYSARLEKPGNGDFSFEHRARRAFALEHVYVSYSSDLWIERAVSGHLKNYLREVFYTYLNCGRDLEHAAYLAQDALAKVIAYTSSQHEEVGSDCLTVTMLAPPLTPASVLVRYCSATDDPRIAYAPWVISRARASGPTELVGNFSVQLDSGIQVMLDGGRVRHGELTPDGRQGILFSYSRQPRQDPPT